MNTGPGPKWVKMFSSNAVSKPSRRISLCRKFFTLVLLFLMGTLVLHEVTNSGFNIVSYKTRAVEDSNDPFRFIDQQKSNVNTGDRGGEVLKPVSQDQDAFKQRHPRDREGHLKAENFKGPKRRLNIDIAAARDERLESQDDSSNFVTSKSPSVSKTLKPKIAKATLGYLRQKNARVGEFKDEILDSQEERVKNNQDGNSKDSRKFDRFVTSKSPKTLRPKIAGTTLRHLRQKVDEFEDEIPGVDDFDSEKDGDFFDADNKNDQSLEGLTGTTQKSILKESFHVRTERSYERKRYLQNDASGMQNAITTTHPATKPNEVFVDSKGQMQDEMIRKRRLEVERPSSQGYVRRRKQPKVTTSTTVLQPQQEHAQVRSKKVMEIPALSSDEEKYERCKDQMKFKIEHVTEAFLSCEDDVKIDKYIIAFKELNRFFRLMGTVFGFVASDIDEKINILEKLRVSSASENYNTIKQMMKFEIDNDLLNKKGFVNGCRTLLRLHRALEFINSFMLKLSQAKFGDPTSSIAQTSYKSTLAKFHPWLLQKGGVVAMYSLPTKKNLVLAVMSESCLTSEKHINSVMKKMAESAVYIYKRTQKLYEQHNLLNLP